MDEVVVTGASGFLGSYLVTELQAAGYLVHRWDMETGQDVRKPPPLPAGTRFVFHLAALTDIVPSITDPIPYMGTNVQGTVRMLERAREAKVEKFVYAASASCYGDEPPNPTPESAPIRCRYPYAVSKYMGEIAAFLWSSVYGLPVNALRIFNAYGRRQNPRPTYGAVLSVFLKQKATGQPMTIIGDGDQARDFVHAKDVARAFRLAAESSLSGFAWNVGSGVPLTVNQLAQSIGGDVVHIPDRPGEPRVTCADITRIARDLHWTPEVHFDDGLANLLAHPEDVAGFPLWTPATIAAATEDWHRVMAPIPR